MMSNYRFFLEKNKFDKTIVGERIRDIVFKGNKLILFLEDKVSI